MLFSSLIDGICKLFRRGQDAALVAPLLQQAYQLQHNGDIAGACKLYQRILTQNPRNAQAHHFLGALLGQNGELDKAGLHLREAIALAPDLVDAYIDLGNICKLQGDGRAAEACYRAALVNDPDAAAAHYNLALVLRHNGQYDMALQHLEHACALLPDFEDAVRERAQCLILMERHDEARLLLAEAVARSPGSGPLQACLGFVYQKMHCPQAALEKYELARRLGRADAELFGNLAVVLQDLGRINDALACYDRAIELQDDPKLRRLPIFHRALARLLMGDFSAWCDYELRLISEDCPRRTVSAPRWEGAELAGRTILIYGEQGLGDEIMFASCIPDVMARAKHCVIECSPKLESLFRRSFPAATVYAATPERRVPDEIAARGIDCEVPAGSLPLHVRRHVSDFPRQPGYLKADPQRVAYWRRRLDGLGAGLKVGISWQGGTHKTRSPLRSVPLAQWLPILRCPGVRWVSLQYGDADAALAELRTQHGIHVAHWQEAIDDYDETAALMGALDLTISVCTAVIHLGGALGRPVWVMAPLSPEWRYGIAGETMPWYPSVHVFRQSVFGEWSPVILRVARQLHELGCSPAERPQTH